MPNRAQTAAAADADSDSDSDSDSDEEGHVESDDDEEAPAAAAAAGAGGAAAPDLDSVTMTNKAGSCSVEWNKAGSIRVDERTGPRFKPAMLWPPDVKGREEDDYFFHFSPRDMAGCITGWSNEARCADAEDAKMKPITQCEIVMALGYLVAAASVPRLNPAGSRGGARHMVPSLERLKVVFLLLAYVHGAYCELGTRSVPWTGLGTSLGLLRSVFAVW